jgi:hypothetical protein
MLVDKIVSKNVWNDPVWSTVIATVILAALAGLGSYFLNWWPDIGGVLVHIWVFLGQTTLVPWWLLLLLILLSLPFLMLAALGVWYWLFAETETNQSADWRSYTTDDFFGLRWRWRYESSGTPVDITCFCPRCDYQVYPDNYSPFRRFGEIKFQCDSCGSGLAEFEESYQSLENKVARFIQQKLRNKTWMDRVAI